jgi:hypothetical protein
MLIWVIQDCSWSWIVNFQNLHTDYSVDKCETMHTYIQLRTRELRTKWLWYRLLLIEKVMVVNVEGHFCWVLLYKIATGLQNILAWNHWSHYLWNFVQCMKILLHFQQFDGTSLKISGWGITYSNSMSLSPELKVATVIGMSNNDCTIKVLKQILSSGMFYSQSLNC